ncbi:GNAT family N-acetyltransferase [Oceanirhabdus seepicola]|uniref:GNAT family N-acetyltransferase n=1 Tax=Oceanirhabdus seepicola TaxID=2828781 RepID=A0A9J6NYJ3_9CLOT|nr:GNAT family N-acetyltransferase [Oceanirhabdus seepicola]MCM1989046.1 GNAT family N-acetyltransferase [Oceanirhabdus seepicola]
MIYELDKSQFERIRSLMEKYDAQNHVTLNAILEGNNRGKIYVDNIEKPKTALVWAMFSMYILIGDSKNPEFINSLEDFFTHKLGPENLSLGATTFIGCFLGDDGWKDTLDSIFKCKNPEIGFRQNFRFNKRKYLESTNITSELPENCYVKKIDNELLQSDTDETISVDVHEFWNSKDKFFEKGIGFCVIKDGRTVSSCISCQAVNREYEISIVTYNETDRNKGYGSLAATAFVDYCVSNNITPHWDAYEDNYSSVALAEKLGFEKTDKYLYYAFLF